MTIYQMPDVEIYDFSFVAASLRLKGMTLLASTRSDEELDIINLFGNGKWNTARIIHKQITKRLENLTPEERMILAQGNLDTQKHMAFLAVCKTHAFIRDFTVEVLREKVLVFDYQVTEGDFLSFLRRKQELHLEMDDLTEKSLAKIRQVTFKILEQAGLIDAVRTKMIQPQLLDQEVIKAIILDDPQLLKLFFLSDPDINQLMK